MTDAHDTSPEAADKPCLATLEERIDAVPPHETATIDVPDDCPVSAGDALQLGGSVKAFAFEQKDGVMSPSRLLVEGGDKPADTAPG